MVDLIRMGEKACAAKYDLQKMDGEHKNRALEGVAAALLEHEGDILKANLLDIGRAEERGMHPGMVDRLRLDGNRLRDMAEGLRTIMELEDPVFEVLESFDRPNGLRIEKKRVPIGVIGIIYESRPNVTADAFGLCFKAGNAVILKGGSDAIHSNGAITDCIREALRLQGLNEDMVQLIGDTDRETAAAFMKLDQYVDVLIPRGGAGLIKAVVSGSTIPVIETGTGNCHIYIDEFADIGKAIPIIVNAKTQRIGVCNACESLVVHKNAAAVFLPKLDRVMKEAHVELRGDEDTLKVLKDCRPACEEDFGKEFLDYILSVKVVDSMEEAIAHINKYNTGHSEAIITEDAGRAEQFLRDVDAACVYVNASTRFTDGFVFGFGAEIGISTQKIHARGPMGLKELTSYKYTIHGNGQIRE